MNPHPLKPRIKVAIGQFFALFRPGDVFRSEDCVKYVHRHVSKYLYSDTILRYSREMRQDGDINWTCDLKHDRLIRVLKPGEPHSR